MRDEITAAANWWMLQLQRNVKNKQMLEDFRRNLMVEMEKAYTGHWHEDNAARGSGYRSISFDHRLDTLILRAGDAAGLQGLDKLLASARFMVMFVNPGEVKVRSAVDTNVPAHYIYSRDGKYQQSSQSSGSNSNSPTVSPSLSPTSSTSSLSSPGATSSLPPAIALHRSTPASVSVNA